MAKSDEKAADEDDRDEDPRDEDESEAEEASPPPAKTASADHGEDEDEDDADEADDPLPPPPPKPTVQAVTPPPPAASLGKSVGTFTLVLGGLFVLFFVLGNAESPFSNQAPKWRIGQTVPVDLTLDPSDDTKLSCAAKTEIGGKRCEYEDKTTKFAGALKDETMMRPYTTLDGQHLLAAGVWSAPELEKAKRPTGRFTVRCDFKVEGKVNAPAIRWDFAGAWNEKNEEWFAGSASNCKLQK
ncbi:MAG: hypothetical protein JNK04_18325 [Myxococcales bacterium]|nr:hypothetical protein [Myxococcales bacterium]